MSLIEEALRRVQDPTVSGKTAPPQIPRQEEPKQAAAPAAHSWTPAPRPAATPRTEAQQTPQALMAVAFTILVLTATLIAGGAFWMTRMGRPASVTASAPAASPAIISPATAPEPSTAAVQPELEAPKGAIASWFGEGSAKQDELLLTGIAEGIGEPYAVINGGIIAIGERVGRFTLVQVHNGAAVLRRDDGTDTILRVAR